ncbi:MAG TPA: enoyl-CoA hydratase-related protein [Pyrinomonadaceae bacterium]
MSSLIYQREDQIAVITLNRPAKLNALSSELIADLSEVLTRLDKDDALRALILTGAGNAFSAGTDISELTNLTETEALEASARGQQLCDRIESFPVPVIAAINGVAAGGGCELALACHMRIASTNARFSLPETGLGLIPAYGGTQRLSRDMAVAHALEMMLAGREVDADSALQLGLLNHVVEPDKLMNEVRALATQIAALAPLAIRACLKAVTEGLKLPFEEGLALEQQLFAGLFATEDAKEGTRAFLEKRPPIFRGR